MSSVDIHLPGTAIGHECPAASRARVAWTLGPRPPMRMPGNTGGIVVTRADSDPTGALIGFSGFWSRRLDPDSVGEHAVVVQLFSPARGVDTADRSDVFLWFTQRRRWRLLRGWKNIGPGWPHEAAPLVHAALAAQPPSTHTTTTSAEHRPT